MKTLWLSRIGTWLFKPRYLLIVILFLLTLVVLYFTGSDAYEDAKHFAQTNPEIAKRIGHVSEVSMRFWDGFHITESGSGGNASLVLELKGEREEAVLDIRLRRIANSWRVEDAYLSTKNEKGISVLPK